MVLLVLNRFCKNFVIRILFLLYSLTLKFSFQKTLEIFKLLLAIFRINFKETPNIC